MTQQADKSHRVWMLAALHHVAELFGLDPTGTATFGWNHCGVGTAATSRTGGDRRWLRVVTEHLSWINGDWWTGNQDAADITKPRVLDAGEWTDDGQALRSERGDYADLAIPLRRHARSLLHTA